MTIPRIPITGKSRTLPSPLMRKLVMRGVYDPEIVLAIADRKTKAAADALRNLIKTTYAEDAESVLCQVRRRVSESGALDGAGVAGLNAEAEIYNECASRVAGGTFEVDEWGRIDLAPIVSQN